MESLPDLNRKLKELSGHGAAYAIVGSFLLYLLGYLVLRFHLTALGIGTDLAVLDERYLFAGANFLIYLCAMTPSLMLLVLLPAGVLYGVYRGLPAGWRAKIRISLGKAVERVAQPAWLLLGGIVFSVFMIQFVMRDCFELSNLLLRPDFPVDSRLGDWLRREDEGRIALFFLGLVGGCALSGLILLTLRQRAPAGDFLVLCHYLLFFLAAVQVLLLPVNYGYLVYDKSLPRVASLDGSTPLVPGMEAWLVWEGKQGMTYLLRNTQNKPATKSLVTLSRDQVKRIEITAHDRIFSTLFASPRGTIQ